MFRIKDIQILSVYRPKANIFFIFNFKNLLSCQAINDYSKADFAFSFWRKPVKFELSDDYKLVEYVGIF